MRDFDSDRDDEIDYSDSFVRFRNFYEYISNPRWYTDLLNEFWKEKLHGYFILDEHGAGHHCSDYGNLYYLNKHIDLEKYDKELLKVIRNLYKNREIAFPYRMKDFYLYAIMVLYNKTHDIKLVQKRLGHTNPNTTRCYLQNAGIKLDNDKSRPPCNSRAKEGYYERFCKTGYCTRNS